MANYKTPGVYVEEVSVFPPSVAPVATAIPAFIGYSEQDPKEPAKIESMVEYESIFGGPAKELPDFTINSSGAITSDADILSSPVYKMYYMLQMYFANGGGPCYIISAGAYKDPVQVSNILKSELSAALNLLEKEDEPTLILFPDAESIGNADAYHNLYVEGMAQSAKLGDRFTLCDVKTTDPAAADPVGDAADTFRTKIGINNLMYGAAYYPNLQTSLAYQYKEEEVSVNNDGTAMFLSHSDNSQSLFHQDNEKYYKIKKMIEAIKLVLPPSAAVAGVYASVDRNRGVWKSPANVSLNRVAAPTVLLNDGDQEDLNVHTTGKSINAIRTFSGKGILIWGARTLDGNSNEWRYISVRRFFNMVEESTKKASGQFVFEPNDANTWVKVKAMIENFLILQWRAGALMGAKAENAFYVKVGLGETMTQQDVLNGKMIVEIGMAAVRPAEFIILRFSHKMIES